MWSDSPWTLWAALAAGSVYAALVIGPYLGEERRWLNMLGLLVAGAGSYYLAIMAAGNVGSWPVSFTIAGLVGVGVLVVPSLFFLPYRMYLKGWLALALAGATGGFCVGVGYELEGFGLDTGDIQYYLPGHLAFKVLVCAALYYALQPEANRK